ncbi:MAG: hypothetical protein VZR14_02740 [Hallerella sp.]|jgi:hypothetical protein|nr:hypothetical protein [Hallerella sp.]
MKFRLLMCCAWVLVILVAVLLAFAILCVLEPSLADRVAEVLGPGKLSGLVRILY